MNFQSMNLYDRQIRTYGMDAVLKMTSSSVLIYGLEGGLATEVGKNLALGGIKNIYLFDDESVITETDLLTGYYYINSLGDNRAKVLSFKLQELNNNCLIHTTKELNNNQNVTIFINKEYKEVTSKVVVLYSRYINEFGANGCIFVDAGDNHIITDLTGEIFHPVHIKSINNNIITCTTNHKLDDNDIITFYNLEGDNLDQFDVEFKIRVVNRNSFKIEYNPSPYTFINGMIKLVKKPIIINHSRFNNVKSDDEIINYYLSLKSFDNLSDFMPTVSLFGSIGASEVIKLVTNKYMPCDQWLSWNDKNVINNNNFEDVKLFVVGSGAIGCELLKNFGMLNINNIIITDPDSIEISNLNRQFLFRDWDINKPKSHIAANAIKKMNPNINIEPLLEKVGPNNIKFTDSIIGSNKITAVFNALDNIVARKFIDDQCLKYGVALFESGTTGTKGNTQPIIPFITETYSASNDPENEKSYPVCTIKSFPNEIAHTIHWAMEQFEILKSNNDSGITLFNKLYYENIMKLLEDFPKDYKLENGELFWSGGKKCPIPIKYDTENYIHVDFVNNTNKLIESKSYELFNKETGSFDKDTGSFDKDTGSFDKDTGSFDKDNELHISWVHSASNLRAINYNIPIVDIYETKGISGKIIPAIATTTSAVAGLIIMEFIKYINKSKIEDYRSTFINIADPLIVYSEPMKAPFIEIAGVKINSWTQFIYSNNSTLGEFKEYYDKLFQTNINMIVFNSAMIYADFLGEEALNESLLDIITRMELDNDSIIVSIFNEESVDLPNIILHI